MLYSPIGMGSRVKYVLGLDIGGTKIAAGIVDSAGKIRISRRIPTQVHRGFRPVMDSISHFIGELQNDVDGRRPLAGLGVAAPGPVIDHAIVESAPNMPGWKRVPLKKILSKRTGLKTFLENDANAAALAEYRFGAGKGAKSLLYVTVSTGIGGGIILNGELYGGSSGGAGEIGHMQILPNGPRCGCGMKGCLEAISSGTAMAKAARRSSRLKGSRIWTMAGREWDAITALTIGRAAHNGDRLALGIIHQSAKYLGIGLANAVQLLNLDRIVIGGGVAQMGELFLEAVRKNAYAHMLPALGRNVKIQKSTLRGDVGILGAAAVCFQNL